MGWKKSLFDDDTFNPDASDFPDNKPSALKKEVPPLDRLKNLEAKITGAVEKVKLLKEEKAVCEKKIKELETLLNEKNQEIEALKSEKVSVKGQIEELLDEIETLEI